MKKIDPCFPVYPDLKGIPVIPWLIKRPILHLFVDITFMFKASPEGVKL